MSDIVYIKKDKYQKIMINYCNFQDLMEQARKSIQKLLEHNLAIYCMKLMLIVEGFQISNHDILSMSEEMFLNAQESGVITKLYLELKNPKLTNESQDEWYTK